MPVFKHLEKPEELLESLAFLFRALSDPARLRILNLLGAKGELCNCHIEQVTGYGNSKISRHLNYLKQNALIQARREGVWIYYSLKPATDSIQEMIHCILDALPDRYALLQQDIESINTIQQEKQISCQS
ncbi:metalloregulator ArsR/SmtB family transcription factor [Deltaproteobacteria bacterium TL4]